VFRESIPDFTTESTEITETDGKEKRVRARIRNPFLPASVASVLSVVKLRIAHLAGESRKKWVVSTHDRPTPRRRWQRNLQGSHGRLVPSRIMPTANPHGEGTVSLL
jgi:hypothetical protein